MFSCSIVWSSKPISFSSWVIVASVFFWNNKNCQLTLTEWYFILFWVHENTGEVPWRKTRVMRPPFSDHSSLRKRFKQIVKKSVFDVNIPNINVPIRPKTIAMAKPLKEYHTGDIDRIRYPELWLITVSNPFYSFRFDLFKFTLPLFYQQRMTYIQWRWTASNWSW